MMKSKFKELCEFINSYEIGQPVKRKEITLRFSDSRGSIDTYRRMLSVAMYLSEGEGDGKYILLRKIPEIFTTTKLCAEIYSIQSAKNFKII